MLQTPALSASAVNAPNASFVISLWWKFVQVITWFRVHFWINKHEWIFQRLTKFGVFWKIYKCFIPNCTRKIMWLLINNTHEKTSRRLTKRNARVLLNHHDYAININCAIQGVRLIWKQKIWLAICEFLWSLTNQNAWFVTSFCTELTLSELFLQKLHCSLPIRMEN